MNRVAAQVVRSQLHSLTHSSITSHRASVLSFVPPLRICPFQYFHSLIPVFPFTASSISIDSFQYFHSPFQFSIHPLQCFHCSSPILSFAHLLRSASPFHSFPLFDSAPTPLVFHSPIPPLPPLHRILAPRSRSAPSMEPLESVSHWCPIPVA